MYSYYNHDEIDATWFCSYINENKNNTLNIGSFYFVRKTNNLLNQSCLYFNTIFFF